MIAILAAVSFTVFFSMNNLHTTFGLKFKPFTCEPCLSAWAAAILIICPVEIQQWVATVFSAGVISPVILKLINNI